MELKATVKTIQLEEALKQLAERRIQVGQAKSNAQGCIHPMDSFPNKPFDTHTPWLQGAGQTKPYDYNGIFNKPNPVEDPMVTKLRKMIERIRKNYEDLANEEINKAIEKFAKSLEIELT